jgi:hypothetical protein
MSSGIKPRPGKCSGSTRRTGHAPKHTWRGRSRVQKIFRRLALTRSPRWQLEPLAIRTSPTSPTDVVLVTGYTSRVRSRVGKSFIGQKISSKSNFTRRRRGKCPQSARTTGTATKTHPACSESVPEIRVPQKFEYRTALRFAPRRAAVACSVSRPPYLAPYPILNAPKSPESTPIT